MSARNNQARLRAWIEAYKKRPDQALALKIAKALYRLDYLSEAFRWAKHLKEKFPSFNQGLKLYQKIKRRTVSVSLRQARERARVSPTPENIVRFCELLRVAGKFRRAFRLARKADRTYPDDWQVQLVIGKLEFDRFSRTENDETGWDAVEHLDRSRCLNPDNYSTLILLAIALARLRSYDDALAVVDSGLELAPRDLRALRLKRRILKALDESSRRGAQEPEEAQRADAVGEHPLLATVLAVHGAVGAFLFNKQGRVTDRKIRQNRCFDFSAPDEVFEAMAAACRLNTHRIGLGDLLSCSLTGEGWNAVYHTAEAGPVLTFFEGDFSGEDVEAEINGALRQHQTALSREPVGAATP